MFLEICDLFVFWDLLFRICRSYGIILPMISLDKKLKLSDFHYDLPESLIAQQPIPVRDQSKLMVVGRETGIIEHGIFSDLGRYLVPGDLLVVNNTKVCSCRIPAKKSGGGKAEIFLLAEQERNCWTALVKGTSGKGKKLIIKQGIEAEILKEHEDMIRNIRFHGIHDIRDVLSTIGQVPLPPYIKRDPTTEDCERYQTVYASDEGAVAAPTAGLHFTSALIQRLLGKGIEFCTITLHVGLGTFQPVRVDTVSDHKMLPEQYTVTSEAASAMNKAHKEGRRVIAVGTTSVRTIETAADDQGMVHPGTGDSELFIYPGYQFKVTNGIITNFHLPNTTLLMLISAFGGRERMLSAYKTAIEQEYRFYSYGDAMLILS